MLNKHVQFLLFVTILTNTGMLLKGKWLNDLKKTDLR